MKLERTRMRNAAHTCSLIAAAVVSVLPLAAAPSVASAETHGYVISWFATATNEPDVAVNCPRAAQDPKSFKFATDGSLGTPTRGDRAYVSGKLISVYDYPDAVRKGLNIETAEGGWIEIVDSAPGRAIRITGADLSKDGPVTVTLDRTLQHLSTGHHTYTHEEPIDLKLGYQLKCSWFQQFYFQGLCRYAMMLDQLKEGDGSLLDHQVLFAFTEHGAPVSSWGTGSIT